MSRSLNSTITTALTADLIQPFFAVDLLFDSPNQVYLWNGVGTRSLTSDSGTNSYAGAGELLQIDPIEEASDISARGATISLSGIDNSSSSLFVKALGTPYQGRVCNIYFGVFDSSGNPSNIEEIFSGYMDQMNIDEGAETTTITLTVENKLVSLERPAGTRYTSAYQRERHPDANGTGNPDLGLDFVVGLQTKKIIWGAIPE